LLEANVYSRIKNHKFKKIIKKETQNIFYKKRKFSQIRQAVWIKKR